MPASSFLMILGIVLLIANPVSSLAFAQPVSSSFVSERLQAACSFLKGLYNPALGLVRSTPNSSVYYIASDSLLAEKALNSSSCAPTISQGINESISSCCGRGNDGMHEALL